MTRLYVSGQDFGDIGGYYGGVPAVFLLAESTREANIVRTLVGTNDDSILIEFSYP